jgi:hypothetical protein
MCADNLLIGGIMLKTEFTGLWAATTETEVLVTGNDPVRVIHDARRRFPNVKWTLEKLPSRAVQII